MAWWIWLSGKKTVIGSVCGWLALNGIPFAVETFNLDMPWIAQVVSILTWIAGILVPVGVGHKIAKAKKQ